VPRIIRPAQRAAPIIAHVPHAAIAIPSEVRAEIVLTDEELADELLRLTDRYTDELFAGLAELGATLFVNDLSRFVFDPERFLDDSVEPMAARGQGVVYWLGTRSQPLRAASTEVRERHVRERYRPYHEQLDSLVAEALDASEHCLVLDCHSFPSVPLPSEIDQSPHRPDICIGTDPVHTPEPLAAAMEAAFAAEGLRVLRDSPFAGTFVPSGSYGTDARVHSLMIEVRRGLYMDEASGERLPAFDGVGAAITRAVAAALGQT
jgi:N-formylglutamate amidohydrolase